MNKLNEIRDKYAVRTQPMVTIKWSEFDFLQDELQKLLVINLRLEEIQKVAVEALENVKHAVGNSKTLEGPLRKCIEALTKIAQMKGEK